jgi:hypothetical protein
MDVSSRSTTLPGTYWSASVPVWPYNRNIGLPRFYVIVDCTASIILVPGILPLFVDASTNYFCNSPLLWAGWIYLIYPWSTYCIYNLCSFNQLHEETTLQLFHDFSSQSMFHVVGTAIMLYSFSYYYVLIFLFLHTSLNFHINIYLHPAMFSYKRSQITEYRRNLYDVNKSMIYVLRLSLSEQLHRENYGELDSWNGNRKMKSVNRNVVDCCH